MSTKSLKTKSFIITNQTTEKKWQKVNDFGVQDKKTRVIIIIHFNNLQYTWPSQVPLWISPKRHLGIKMLMTTKKQQHLIKYYRWWLWEWSDQARKMFSSRKLRKLYDWTYPSDFRFSPTAASLEWTLLAAAHLVMGKAWNRVVKTAGKPKAHLSKIATEEATENCLGNSHPQQNPMHV